MFNLQPPLGTRVQRMLPDIEVRTGQASTEMSTSSSSSSFMGKPMLIKLQVFSNKFKKISEFKNYQLAKLRFETLVFEGHEDFEWYADAEAISANSRGSEICVRVCEKLSSCSFFIFILTVPACNHC